MTDEFIGYFIFYLLNFFMVSTIWYAIGITVTRNIIYQRVSGRLQKIVYNFLMGPLHIILLIIEKSSRRFIEWLEK